VLKRMKGIRRSVTTAVTWLDGHNGLLTALATVAIAALTYFVASSASEQGKTTSKQLIVMQGQLDEMKASFAVDRAYVFGNFNGWDGALVVPGLAAKLSFDNFGRTPGILRESPGGKVRIFDQRTN
jgi:hypothetical protein